MPINVLAVGCVLLCCTFIVGLMRARKLRERYAIMWFVLGVVLLFLALFPRVLVYLAEATGFELPSNFVFFCAIVVLIGVCLQLSSALGHAEERMRTLTEATALVEERVRELETMLRQKESDDA